MPYFPPFVDNTKVLKAGDTMTGALTLQGNASNVIIQDTNYLIASAGTFPTLQIRDSTPTIKSQWTNNPATGDMVFDYYGAASSGSGNVYFRNGIGTGTGMYINSAGRLVLQNGATNTGSNIDLNGLKLGITSKTANYTATLTDDTMLFDTTSGTLTCTLPTASSSTGKVFYIKKIAGSNNLVIDGNGSETIDGSTTLTITTLWQSVTIQCTGSSWVVI